MGRPQDRSRCEGSPGSALPCIWMSAGLVAYKLCDRAWGCESCPFDQAMRGAIGPRGEGRSPRPETGIGIFPGDRRYHPAHTWAQERGAGRVRLGVDAFFAWLAGRGAAVVLAAPGSRVERDRPACWWVDGPELVPVVSPVCGRVRRRNESLAADPGLAAADPYGGGWLLEVETAGALAGLLAAAEARRRSEQQRESFLAAAGRELARGRETVGATLADGGRRLDDLKEMLGRGRYHRLAGRYLRPGAGRTNPSGGARRRRRS